MPIEKVSETEVKITTVTPEVVIPEKIEEVVISLADLKAKTENLDVEIARWTGYRATPLAELEKIDNEATIVEAVNQGVKDNTETLIIDPIGGSIGKAKK